MLGLAASDPAELAEFFGAYPQAPHDSVEGARALAEAKARAASAASGAPESKSIEKTQKGLRGEYVALLEHLTHMRRELRERREHESALRLQWITAHQALRQACVCVCVCVCVYIYIVYLSIYLSIYIIASYPTASFRARAQMWLNRSGIGAIGAV